MERTQSRKLLSAESQNARSQSVELQSAESLNTDQGDSAGDEMFESWERLSMWRDEALHTERLLVQMKEGLEVKSRRYMGSVYPECFIGSECVSWLIEKQLASSREAAVHLGNSLLELGHFQHVTGDHSLEDAYLFYRFSVSQSGNKKKELRASADSKDKKIQVQQQQISELCSLLENSGSPTGSSRRPLPGTHRADAATAAHQQHKQQPQKLDSEPEVM
jgi:hypothetical protein